MDIFAHGLWSAVAAKAVNKRKSFNSAQDITLRQAQGVRVSVWKAAFWGVAPDLFAFTIPFIWLIWNSLFGETPVHFPSPERAEPPVNGAWIFQLAGRLYNISHSLVVAAAVLFAIWLLWKNKRKLFPLAMLAWPLHILIDIPTHSYRFYPTPFLWPVSEWKFDGFSWGTPWFMVANYGALIIAFWILRQRQKTGDI